MVHDNGLDGKLAQAKREPDRRPTSGALSSQLSYVVHIRRLSGVAGLERTTLWA